MTRKTRKALFYILLLAFFILGAAILLYAEGWRLDLGTFKAEKVGAIYVRSFPDNATISLDGKPIPNQSGFLSQGTFMSDLFPKNYQVSLSAPGYDSWNENAEVAPSLVTEFKYAVLVPQSGAPVTTSTPPADFFESDGNMVTQNASGTIMWRGKIVADGTIISHSTNFADMITETAPGGNYLLYDFTDGSATNLSALLDRASGNIQTISNILIDPYNSDIIIAETASRVWTIDPAAEAVSAIATTTSGMVIGTPLAVSPSFIAWPEYDEASGTSRIVVYDRFAHTFRNNTITISGTITNLTWISGDALGILENNGSLYRYAVSSNNFQTMADDVKSFYPSADGTMVAAREAQSVEIFSLADPAIYYRFNLPEIGAIQSLTWYKDDNHLFVQYSDYIAFLDLADTDLRNLTTVAPIAAGSTFSYDAQANTLFLVDAQGALMAFDFPS